jgi:hypothetical protein
MFYILTTPIRQKYTLLLSNRAGVIDILELIVQLLMYYKYNYNFSIFGVYYNYGYNEYSYHILINWKTMTPVK